MDSDIKAGFSEEVTQAENLVTRRSQPCENLREGCVGERSKQTLRC